MTEIGSKEITAAAVKMAVTADRTEEQHMKGLLNDKGIRSVAIDYGGDFMTAIPKILERAVVAAKREGVIGSTHAEEGAVAGAAHEAINQIASKALGLNLGGKIAIARYGTHIAVCVFFAVGLLNLNDVAMGVAHRAV
ncbi:MAG: HutP family protein [Eubacteriales bacterium]|nr:HutP family protein [Eubacteriales bacterium]